MPLFSLAEPFEDARSPAESQALALVGHLESGLAAWREGKDQAHRKAALEQTIKDQITKKDEIEAEVEGYDAVIEASAKQAKTALIVSIAFGVAALAIWASGVSGILGFIVLVAAGGAFAYRSKQAAAGQQAAVAQDRAKAGGKDLVAAISSSRANLRLVKAEIEKRADAYPEVSLASVALGVEVAEVAGRTVLLDNAGFHDLHVLRVFDATPIKQTVEQLKGEIGNLNDVPVMLSVDAEASGDDPLNTLYGEEDRISALVDDFSSGLGSLNRIEIGLPVMDGDSTLVRRLRAGELDPVESATTLAIGTKASGDEIGRFVEEISRARETGEEALVTLGEVANGLEAVCLRYSQARENSINAMHANLLDVLDKANWCNRRFYCPRTIMSPAYIQSLIGIDLADAHLLAAEDLVQRLRSDPEIAKRLDAEPELPQRLLQQYRALHQLLDHIRGFGDGTDNSLGERTRIYQAEQAELVRAFRATLQEVLTGARQPLLEISREAVLFFDPDQEIWSSATSPYTYSSPDVVRYGAIVKAYSDLMLPLWEHLWTEKADFRKSELFRTNQDMIRMSEKESEKLIDIANEFRADMRTVRENANIFRADLNGKIAEIRDFRNSMEHIGLLSEHMQQTMSDERIAALDLEGGGVDAIDGYEYALTRAPQAQAETRGTMRDPIDYVREPNIVISALQAPAQRLALGNGVTDV